MQRLQVSARFLARTNRRTSEEGTAQNKDCVGDDGTNHLPMMVNMCCVKIGVGTYGSLDDPNFSLKKGDDAHDDFNRVPESSVQEAGKSLPEGQGHLFCSIAKQLQRH